MLCSPAFCFRYTVRKVVPLDIKKQGGFTRLVDPLFLVVVLFIIPTGLQSFYCLSESLINSRLLSIVNV